MKEKYVIFSHGGSNSEPSLFAYDTYKEGDRIIEMTNPLISTCWNETLNTFENYVIMQFVYGFLYEGCSALLSITMQEKMVLKTILLLCVFVKKNFGGLFGLRSLVFVWLPLE